MMIVQRITRINELNYDESTANYADKRIEL